MSPMNAGNERSAVSLDGVPETMLWTLHNRAEEARRADTFLKDPDCVRIHDAIAYDYAKSFGKADGSHAARSKAFDVVVVPWMKKHPGGVVVELAAGLETQFQRVDDGAVRWFCVDLPEAIATRERFLPAPARGGHIGKSALDRSWFDDVANAVGGDGVVLDKGLFVSAQGLFMYFEEAEVQQLLTALIARFPGVEIMFDTIPHWFSNKTMKGMRKTKEYTTPKMPWGIARSALSSTLRGWSSGIVGVDVDVVIEPCFEFFRGVAGVCIPVLVRVPVVRDQMPAIAHLSTRRR